MCFEAFEVKDNGFSGMLDGFLAGVSLCNTSGECRHFDNKNPILILLNQNTVFHGVPLLVKNSAHPAYAIFRSGSTTRFTTPARCMM